MDTEDLLLRKEKTRSSITLSYDKKEGQLEAIKMFRNLSKRPFFYGLTGIYMWVENL